jgi:DNA modification methylase
MSVRIIQGDCREMLTTLPDQSVNCCVTSPPYFGLRDYGVDGQMGLEPTPDEFVAGMVAVFREVRRVLRDDGTLWLNIGDSYSTHAAGKVADPMAKSTLAGVRTQEVGNASSRVKGTYRNHTLPEKNLIGVPWRLAFALQADGWVLRQDIIWSKPNPMPESVQDRCTKAHEYLFLLSKGPRYHYDAEAIAEPLGLSSIARLSQNVEDQAGSERVPGKTNGAMKAVGRRAAGNKTHKYATAYDAGAEVHRTKAGLVGFAERERAKVDAGDLEGTRNRRSVWEVATQPFKEAHFATFPPALIEPCILAGCPRGGTVLDPFFGAGTTGLVADRLQRDCVGIELNPAYAEIARNRLSADGGMFASIAA